jgi:hypothetical protein
MSDAGLFGQRISLHKNQLALRHAFFWLVFGLAWLMMALPPFRYLFLAMPVLVLLVMIVDGGARFPDEIRPFVAIIVMTLVLAPMDMKEGVKDVYLLSSGLVIGFLKDWPRMRLWWITIALFLAFVILYGVFGNLSSGIHFDIMNSVSSFEGNFSFVFALIAPFALMRKRYFLTLFAVALCILTLKRIAVLAMFLSIVLVMMGERRTRWLLDWRPMIVLNFLALVFLGAYVNGAFDAVIYEMTGQTANQFAQGRVALQSQVFKAVEERPWNFILGHGAGTVYALTVWGDWEGEKRLLHCDSLRLMYEYGLVLWLVFFWLLYRSKSFAVRVSGVLLNVMLLTDNLLAYNFFIYYYLLILGAFYQEQAEAT